MNLEIGHTYESVITGIQHTAIEFRGRYVDTKWIGRSGATGLGTYLKDTWRIEDWVDVTSVVEDTGQSLPDYLYQRDNDI